MLAERADYTEGSTCHCPDKHLRPRRLEEAFTKPPLRVSVTDTPATCSAVSGNSCSLSRYLAACFAMT
jgi:hypothetical protein